jgi:glutathione synthase/RimK-type ligase-like ATP-grasp enzyme
VNLEDIGAAYWRTSASGNPLPNLSAADLAFAQEESEHAWRGWWTALDCYWMNSPECVRQVQSRPVQLKRAAAAGFDLPRTLITSRPEDALEFGEACGGTLVFRVMSPPVLRRSADETAEQSRAICPVLVSTDLLKERASSMGAVPCYFQEYFKNRSELRVMVAGDQVFVAQIETPQPLRQPLHLAGDKSDLTMHVASLPDDIKSKCLTLAASCGLNYAVIELMVTPEGRHVFLEINPNGKFAEVQKRLPELKVADAVASALLHGSDRR